MNDISTKADVIVFVNAFYVEVRKDELIGPVFAAVIPQQDWSVHLARMHSFWNTVLFGQMDYRGNPFSVHAGLPLEHRHFEQWKKLLFQTLNQQFAGPKTEEVKIRANKMGMLFLSKLEHIRANGANTHLL